MWGEEGQEGGEASPNFMEGFLPPGLTHRCSLGKDPSPEAGAALHFVCKQLPVHCFCSTWTHLKSH